MNRETLVSMAKRLILGIVMTLSVLTGCIQQSAEPPATGDWVIREELTVQNRVISLSGSLDIQGGGALTLEKVELTIDGDIVIHEGSALTLREVKLVINSGHPGEHQLLAVSGSSLGIFDSSIEPLNQENPFVFMIDNAELVLRNNEIRGVAKGIRMHSTKGGIIEGNTIYHGVDNGIILSDSRDILIKGNVINCLVKVSSEEIGVGLSIIGSHGNKVVGNHFKNELHPINVNFSWNNEIANNEVAIQSHSTGIMICNESGNNMITNNTIIVDPSAEWG